MDDLTLLLIRRALDTHRYGNDLGARVRAIMDNLAARMAGGVPPGISVRERERIIRSLVQSWRAQSADAFGRIAEMLERELPDVERMFYKVATQDAGRELVERQARPELKGVKVARELAEAERSLMHRAEAQLRQGVQLAESAEQVSARVQRVVARKASEVATVARTAVTSSAQIAYYSGLRAAGVEEYRWVAVLDERTTDLCRSRHDKVYRFDGPNPLPPAHWNCRSHIEPVLEPVEDEPFGAGVLRDAGLNVAAVQRAERELIAEGVAVMRGSGRVRQGWARTPIATLIRDASPETRRAVLGDTGARRFALGMSLGQVASRETSRLSLDQLRNRLL